MSTPKSTKLSQKTGTIWCDGKLLDWQDANIHFLTHGVQYGTGAFEGVRCYLTNDGPAIFRLAEHTKRWLASAKTISMASPYSYAELYAAQLEVVAANNLGNAYIRPIMFFDDSGLGLAINKHEVRTFIAAFEWGAYLGEEGLNKGITVGVSSYRRHNPNISMCRAKVTGNYVNSVLAAQEAHSNGFDEALLLDVDGYISEGPGENLFVVKDGQLYTPELASALDGITRKTVIALAKEQGLAITETRLTRDELYGVDEAFFTGTAAEVTPIREIDRRTIGAGTRGPITEKLQAAYFDCVYGRSPQHQDWLAYLEQPVQAKQA